MPVVLLDHVAIEAADGLLGPQNRASQRVPFPEAAGEELVDLVLGIVHLHLQLFEDDAFFLLDVLRLEQGIADQIGHHVEGFRQMLVQHLDVVADQFLGGERVQAAADGIHRPGNLLRCAVLGALEHHVLDEVRQAGFVQLLFARARGDPQADRDAAHVRHPLGDDAHTIGQNLALDLARFGLVSGLARLASHLFPSYRAGSGVSDDILEECAANDCRDGSCRYRGSSWSETSPVSRTPDLSGGVPAARNESATRLDAPQAAARGVPGGPPRSRAGVRFGGRHAALPAEAGGRENGRDGLDARRGAIDDLHLDTGRLPGGLQVLPHGFAGA